MTRKLPILASIALTFLMISTAKAVRAADVSNGSFEAGDFTGWTSTGQATIETSSYGVTPPDGTYQALVQTCILDGGGCNEGTRLPSAADLETFLGLLWGPLLGLGAIEGSAIKQEITANAGDVLTFSWNFLTDQQDPGQGFDDFAFFTLSSSVNQLANSSSPLLSDSLTTALAKATGYQPYTISIPIAGNYTLSFGVVDVGDNTANSALLVDDIRLTSAAVPEPVSLLGTFIAFGFGAAFTKKR